MPNAFQCFPVPSSQCPTTTPSPSQHSISSVSLPTKRLNTSQYPFKHLQHPIITPSVLTYQHPYTPLWFPVPPSLPQCPVPPKSFPITNPNTSQCLPMFPIPTQPISVPRFPTILPYKKTQHLPIPLQRSQYSVSIPSCPLPVPLLCFPGPPTAPSHKTQHLPVPPQHSQRPFTALPPALPPTLGTERPSPIPGPTALPKPSRRPPSPLRPAALRSDASINEVPDLLRGDGGRPTPTPTGLLGAGRRHLGPSAQHCPGAGWGHRSRARSFRQFPFPLCTLSPSSALHWLSLPHTRTNRSLGSLSASPPPNKPTSDWLRLRKPLSDWLAKSASPLLLFPHFPTSPRLIGRALRSRSLIGRRAWRRLGSGGVGGFSLRRSGRGHGGGGWWSGAGRPAGQGGGRAPQPLRAAAGEAAHGG